MRFISKSRYFFVFLLANMLTVVAFAEPKPSTLSAGADPVKLMSMPSPITVGAFSEFSRQQGPLDHWYTMPFRGKKETIFELTSGDGRTYVAAHSHASAAVFRRDLDINPRQYPYISWEWKVPQLVRGADLTDVHHDDAPARILIGCEIEGKKNSLVNMVKNSTAEFLMGFSWDTRVLLYIWDNKIAPGTILPSPRSSRLRYYIVESGEENLGQWRQNKFNYYEDFYRAFGEYPKKLVAVGLMTDTDAGDETVTAYYGDIALETQA